MSGPNRNFFLQSCSSPASRQDHREQPRVEKGVGMSQFKEWAMLCVAVANLVLDILKTLKARRSNDEPSGGPES